MGNCCGTSQENQFFLDDVYCSHCNHYINKKQFKKHKKQCYRKELCLQTVYDLDVPLRNAQNLSQNLSKLSHI
jgi:hypothetical protein